MQVRRAERGRIERQVNEREADAIRAGRSELRHSKHELEDRAGRCSAGDRETLTAEDIGAGIAGEYDPAVAGRAGIEPIAVVAGGDSDT